MPGGPRTVTRCGRFADRAAPQIVSSSVSSFERPTSGPRQARSSVSATGPSAIQVSSGSLFPFACTGAACS